MEAYGTLFAADMEMRFLKRLIPRDYKITEGDRKVAAFHAALCWMSGRLVFAEDVDDLMQIIKESRAPDLVRMPDGKMYPAVASHIDVVKLQAKAKELYDRIEVKTMPEEESRKLPGKHIDVWIDAPYIPEDN